MTTPARPAGAASPAGPPRVVELVARGLLAVGVVAFAAFHTTLARWKALGLQSEWGFDLTFFHNLVWNVSNGHGYRQSATYHEPPGIFAETHFEPIILLVVPFYKVAPGLTTVFAVQSTLLALGAVGVYRLVKAGAGDGAGVPLAAAGAAFLYLGWWPLWRVAMADVRPLTWALPLLLLCAAALREARHTEAFAWGLLACLSREEIPLLVMGLCAAAWLWRLDPVTERRRIAILLAVAAVVFAVLTTLLRTNTTFYIRPLDWLRTLLGGEDADGAIAQWGQSAGELLGTRLAFLREWFVPLGLGAIFAPELLLASSPMLVYLFSQAHEWASWEGPYIHHSAPAMGLVAAAAAVGWTRILTHPRLDARPADAAPSAVRFVLRALRAVVVTGLIGALFAAEIVWLTGLKVGSEHVIYPRWERHVAEELTPWLEQQDRVVEAHRLAGLVPADASVMADWHTVHLFSGREHVYSYHQESPDVITPGAREPLLAKAEVQPTWALIAHEDGPWMDRAEAHGLVRVESGEEWVLFGPAR